MLNGEFLVAGAVKIACSRFAVMCSCVIAWTVSLPWSLLLSYSVFVFPFLFLIYSFLGRAQD